MPTATAMEKLIALEMAYVTEAAAIASARLMGRGDRHEADRVATEAMRAAMDEVEMQGTIVIGEGERDEAPMLYIGEQVGAATDAGAPRIDIAVDPLEGTNLVATGSPNAITVLAASEAGGLVHAPDTYLEKLCVGPLAAGHVDIRNSPSDNVRKIADVLGRKVGDITVVVLDRPRHEALIGELRHTGARIKLISDGDLSAAISCAVQGTNVHAVMGIGGAPEGVITAAAMRCLGGEIQARFRYRTDAERDRGARMGHGDEERIYHTEDLASGNNLVFAATGVTPGDLLEGVRFFGGGARTHSLVMAYQTKTVRFVDTVHMFDRERPPSVRLWPVAEPRILAFGGHSLDSSSNDGALHQYLLDLTGRERPRICFLGTAGGDSADYRANFYATFAGRAEASHLGLFERRIDDIEGFLLSQDAIYVGGGNTANLLAVWRVHGVDVVLRKAWEAGIVLAGPSAGALCWFEAGLTDSFGFALSPLKDGLRFLKGSFCPHYDSESLRRPRYHELVGSGALPDGYAVDDGVGLLFAGRDVAEAVAVLPETRAFRVERRRNGEVEEIPIRPRIVRV